jgi:hypothetical protein
LLLDVLGDDLVEAQPLYCKLDGSLRITLASNLCTERIADRTKRPGKLLFRPDRILPAGDQTSAFSVFFSRKVFSASTLPISEKPFFLSLDVFTVNLSGQGDFYVQSRLVVNFLLNAVTFRKCGRTTPLCAGVNKSL